MTTQLNVILPKGLDARVRVDAARHGANLSAWATEAFESFLSKNLTARRSHFSGKRVTRGRKHRTA